MIAIRNHSRMIAMLLSLCMLLSIMAVAAFAEDSTTTTTMTTTEAAPSGAPSGTPPSGAPSGTPPSGSPGATPPDGATGGAPGSTTLENADTSANFTDLNSATSWANAYIDALYEDGVITGTATGVYSPNATMKRCDLAVMLYRQFNFATEGFSYGDVATDAYYYQAVMRGKACEVFEANTYFYPTQAVTREQAAIWMYNSLVYQGMPTDMASTDVSAYQDAASISDDAKTAVATLTKLGIFKGDSSGNFNPTKSLTRAELAVAFYRLTSMGGGAGGAAPGGTTGTAGATATVDHGSYANLVTADASDVTYTSTGDQENAVRIEGDVEATLSDITVSKSAGAAGSGDTSNFYGVNAGVLALDGATLTIDGATVNTSVNGANGIFSYGENTTVTVSDATINTSANSSGGIMVTGGGTMYVNDSTIATKGGSSAALRTDRGGGTLVVDGGTYTTAGNGSPAIYSTADVTVSNATLSATGSEAVVVEGKNSVKLTNCDVTGNMVKDNVENLQNVMIYQSMSGDADSGESLFQMTGGSLTANNGDMIYVTNTACEIILSNVVLDLYNDVLLRVVGNDARNGWGVVGSNGGTCTFTADDQTMTGKIIVDEISSLDLSMTNGTAFSGSINSEKEGGEVNVTIDADSTWTLSADSYVTLVSGTTANIDTNGYTLYVNGVAME